MKKIAFFGYDFLYSSLETLLNYNYNVKWLFTFTTDNIVNFNEKVSKLATANGIQIIEEAVTAQQIETLKKEGCELLVVAGYPYRIPIVPDMPKGINIHPTLLPEGRGPWPMPIVILNGLSSSGVTIHKLTRHLDSGDILAQQEFPISELEDLETLSFKIQIHSKNLLIKVLSDFEFYWDNAYPQGEGTYWPMPTFDDRELNWNSSVIDISKVARAFGKFDSLAKFGNKEWVVQDLSVWQENHNFNPGDVVLESNREFLVAAKDGFVCIRFFKIDPDFE